MTRIEDVHHQDVRAAIRKQYGSIVRFEQANGIRKGGVHDILRGYESKRVRQAVEKFLNDQAAA